MNLPPPHPMTPIPCGDAARLIRETAGVFAHAPALSGLLAQLEACEGSTCSGVPFAVVAASMLEARDVDAVLALRN